MQPLHYRVEKLTDAQIDFMFCSFEWPFCSDASIWKGYLWNL